MKFKKIISTLLIYFFMLTVLPFTQTNIAMAADGTGYIKEEIDTTQANKYNIQGYLYDTQTYDGVSVILTSNGLYYIKSGKTTKIELPSDDMYRILGKNGDNIVLLKSRTKNIINIDITNGTMTSRNIDDYKNDDLPHSLTEGTMDSNGNKWLSDSFNNETSFYNLLKIDANGVNTYYDKLNIAYEPSFLQTDANNDLYFLESVSNKIQKLSAQNPTAVTTLYQSNNYEFIFSLKIASNGDSWFIAGDKSTKLVHLNSQGTLIKSYDLNSFASVDIDKNGNVWVLDGQYVKKLVNDTLVTRYQVPNYSFSLNVNKENDLIVSSIYDSSFTLIKPVDTVAPSGSIQINNGSATTDSATVTLNISAADSAPSSGISQMMISNSPAFTNAVWENYETSKKWTLILGDGTKTVYIKFRDKAENDSKVYSASVELTGPPVQATPAPAQSYPGQLLINGVVGQTVTTIQDKLKSLGIDSGNSDGVFGPITRAAIVKYQSQYGLAADGIVGPLTWGRLFGFNVGAYQNLVVQGSGNIPVIGGIQDKLVKLGYELGLIDGIFGSRTASAIKAFQETNKLIVDGIVGPKTWQLLFG